MELWLKNEHAVRPDYDRIIEVASYGEYREYVKDQNIISSVLWFGGNRFSIPYQYARRNHPHERSYINDTKRNLSFLNACKRLAFSLEELLAGSNCLVYAPLRGALPIWNFTSGFISRIRLDVCFPVTSSFVFFPEGSRFRNIKGKPQSGRQNHILEMKRLIPFLGDYDFFIYLDEIVSGSMMKAYLKEMFELKIHLRIPIIAAGLADAFGNRSGGNRTKIEKFVHRGFLHKFIWEGCSELITEDNKFLLGIHYSDYHSGMHVVPFLDQNLEFYPEKLTFEHDIIKGMNGF